MAASPCGSASSTACQTRGADRLVGDLGDRFLQEGADQHVARLGFRDAARAQIEQRIRVEIADRRAMGAFHVVGEDFEFRLQVGFGALAEQQRLGGLAAVGPVRRLRAP